MQAHLWEIIYKDIKNIDRYLSIKELIKKSENFSKVRR